VTDIGERSDGLRTFVALAAFLASGGYKVPPILLIDEAETHLHYNAQADLVGVLLKSIDATQVFYTTHSPGCLPSDLGTGIRLITPDPAHGDASIIKNNFWQGEEPGFAPLLYAMGAGAAAFSMCRKAVLAEGPSDMILLPSLIRRATGERDLEYQVAPGLANAHAFGMRIEEVAAKVVYLTDGDGGGAKHRKDLVDAGVSGDRIFQLRHGTAAEDLVNRDDYVTVVNGLLREMNTARTVTTADLPRDKTVAKALADWGEANRIRQPSKVEVAYALLRFDGLRLTAGSKTSLRRLHEQFMAALAVPASSAN
jgi:predicted ATP-dependent endonuclease of OLD family